MDVADFSDDEIELAKADGINRARQALKNPSLRPIIVDSEANGRTVGLCHYCESEIAVGALFCAVDEESPENSCSVLHEYTRKRREENSK